MRMKKLKTWDIFALGFMTFALFLGAGNIIFPPMVGMAAGENLLGASAGFLLTGVGLPLLGVIALARVGGGLDTLTHPIGRIAGLVLAVAIYLTIGPLFATPRTPQSRLKWAWHRLWATRLACCWPSPSPIL